MHQQSAEQVRREIIQLCHAGLNSRALRVELIQRLRKVLPVDAFFFTTADPTTLLFTGAVADEILVQATPQFLQNEFFQEDVNKFSWLARNQTPVRSLIQSTQNDLEQSPRYTEILDPLALGDELRAALITGGACWGFLCLHRERSSPNFTAAEASFLGQLTGHIAEGLRKSLLLGQAKDLGMPDEPGLLLLADDLSAAAITPAAERWLAEIAETDGLPWRSGPGTPALPGAVTSVVARLQALESGADTQPGLPPNVRLRTVSGRWLVLHASRLSSPGAQNQIAVIIESARPVELAPLIALAYDLSKREGEIMQSVLQGLSTAEIAGAFHISTNTVQDHLKAIFEKAGVRSRRELAGQLFAQQYQPRIMTGKGLDGNGWFRE